MLETSALWLPLTIATLATWRVSHLLAAEDGPADIIVRVRAYLGRSFFGTLMDCFGCVSLWIALPLAVFVTRRPLELVVVWLALSGGAMLLERIGLQTTIIEPRADIREEVESDELLR